MTNKEMEKFSTFEMFPDTQILSLAQEFAKVSALLCNDQALRVPHIVNAVFALELYIKALHAQQIFSRDCELTIERKALVRTNDHSLAALFHKMPKSKQVWLQQLYQELSPEGDISSLYEDLKKFDGVFIAWRYMFEGEAKSVNVSLLNKLVEFFEIACQPISINRYKP